MLDTSPATSAGILAAAPDAPHPSRRWTVVVLSWNGREDTLRCLRSLSPLAAAGVSVVCVDNGSVDGSVEAIRAEHPEVTLVENGRNLGYAGGNNVGIRLALDEGADWVMLLNNDAVLAPDAPGAFEAVARQHPSAGVLAGKVYLGESGERLWFAGQRAWVALGYSGRQRGYGRPDGPRYATVEPTGRATGALMAVSRPCLEAIGLLDEDLFAYVEDVDWSVRARRAGFEVLFVPDARAWHRVSASTGGEHASTHSLYYSVRNMIVVAERHAPLPEPLQTLRRRFIAATYAAAALARPAGRRRALRAVREGYRDAVAGRLGVRAGARDPGPAPS